MLPPSLCASNYKKKKKNNYVLLTVSWLQGFHVQLQSKALYSIWTDISFWWLGCSHVGSWTASEQYRSTDRMVSCLSFEEVTSHGGKLRYFQCRQFKQSLNCEANLHQTPFLQNVMRQAKSLLQNKVVRVSCFILFFFPPRQVTNTFSLKSHVHH